MQRRRKRRQRAAAAVATVTLVALATWASGVLGSDRKFRSCAIVDVSRSTVVSRPSYLTAFSAFATRAGMQGNGDVAVVLAAGDPGADGAPHMTSVAPDGGEDAASQVEEYVAQVTEGLRQALVDPPVKGGGSAIVEAGPQCETVLEHGDRLLLLSDGIQNSPETGDFHDVDLSDAGIDRLLAQLDAHRLLPDLRGVVVEAPLLIHRPGGTMIGAQRQQQIRRFWDAWIRAVGAEPAEQR